MNRSESAVFGARTTTQTTEVRAVSNTDNDGERYAESASHCSNCGEEYSDPNGIASEEYMWQGHVLFDCPDPNQMFKAWLNASPAERQEVWP